MASGVSDRFRYVLTHTAVIRHTGDGRTLTKTSANDRVSGLDRLADRPSEEAVSCDHCAARLRVTLRSAAEVERRRRPYRPLWKVGVLLTVLSGWGLVEVVRGGDGLGDGEFLAMAGSAVATVLFGWGTLWSLLLSRSFDTPEVARTDGPEPTGVRHGWGSAAGRSAERTS
ncbi:hypothetical protein GCM10022233_09900 [Streptomyces shaanxiensis]|uniref:Integral membrane protein n=1 Tax=Streptomyces shaanxiensis TaxID=653357 RepID=A0ABP7UGF8_9ACTN